LIKYIFNSLTHLIIVISSFIKDIFDSFKLIINGDYSKFINEPIVKEYKKTKLINMDNNNNSKNKLFDNPLPSSYHFIEKKDL
jgi:hypothetical protein